MKINFKIEYDSFDDWWYPEKYDKIGFCSKAIEKIFPKTKDVPTAWLTVSSKKAKGAVPLVCKDTKTAPLSWWCYGYRVYDTVYDLVPKILGKSYNGKTFYVTCALTKPRIKKHGIRNH